MSSPTENIAETSDDEGQEDWSDTGWAQPMAVNDVNSNIISPRKQPIHADHSQEGAAADSSMMDLKAEALSVSRGDKTKEVSRMRLNDNKAGMKGLDRERINQIIYEASKGSRFFENERRKDEQMQRRTAEQRERVASLTEIQLRQGQVEADKLLEELKSERRLDRHIVHIDMDAFYAAVEMRDDPSLRDKPMAVGGSAMLSTSNYHARRYGVRAAMPGFIGKKLCPELVIVPTNFDKYTTVSKQVREILGQYDPNFCTMSLDEAYLDFTDHVQQRQHSDVASRTFLSRENTHCDEELCVCDPNLIVRDWLINEQQTGSHGDVHVMHHGAVFNVSTLFAEIFCKPDNTNNSESHTTLGEICAVCDKRRPKYKVEVFGVTVEEAVREMRFRIEQKTRLTASAGIAPNTMVAKVCSDYNKPNGQYRVLPTIHDVHNFVSSLPIRKVSGIGNVSEKMLNAVGVELCSDLHHKRALLYFLYSPISFNYFMRVSLGIGSTRVERDGERKSLSTERSFQEISKPADLFRKCEELCNALWEDLQQEQLMGKTVTLKLKAVSFEGKTRAQTLSDFTNSADVLRDTALDLLRIEIKAVSPQPLRLRLMGVRMSNLIHASHYTKQQQKTISSMFKQLQGKPGSVSCTQVPGPSATKGLEERQEVGVEPCRDIGGQAVRFPTNSTVTHTRSDRGVFDLTNPVTGELDGPPQIQSTQKSISEYNGENPVDKCATDVLSSTADSQVALSTLDDTISKEGNSLRIGSCDPEGSSVLDLNRNNGLLPSCASDLDPCAKAILPTTNVLSPEKKLKSPRKMSTNKSGQSPKKDIPKAVVDCERDQNQTLHSFLSQSVKTKVKEDFPKKNRYTCPVCQEEIHAMSLSKMNVHVDKCLERHNKISQEDTNHLQGKSCVSDRFWTNNTNLSTDMFTNSQSLTVQIPSFPSLKEKGLCLEKEKLFKSTSFFTIKDNGKSSSDFTVNNPISCDHDPNATCDKTENCSDQSDLTSSSLTDSKGQRSPFVEPANENSIDPESVCTVSAVDSSDSRKNQADICETVVSSQQDAATGHTDGQTYTCPICNIGLTVSLERFNKHVDRCLNQSAITSILQEPNSQQRNHKRSSLDRSPSVPASKRKKSSSTQPSKSIMSYMKR